jgi:hypothetical protein
VRRSGKSTLFPFFKGGSTGIAVPYQVGTASVKYFISEVS